jgi:hypothetical protein
MNRVALNRRRFLKLVGASALSYPFLRSVPSYASGDGATSGPGPYLVLLFTACGCVRYQWGATVPGQTATPTGTMDVVTSPLSFRPTLSAFASAGPAGADLSKYVNVLDGLQVKGAGGGSHEAGMAALWTGATVSSNNTIASASIDQVIAPLLATQLQINKPQSNVALMAQSSADYPQRSVQTRMLYDSTGSWVDPYLTPSAALSALFPNASGSSSASSGPDRTAYIRQKVAIQVNADLTAVQKRLCTEDRTQLQNVQALYNQVLAQLAASAAAAASCSPPSIGDAGASNSSSSSSGAATDPFPIYAQAMENILAMTLACDLTRVASLQFSHALSPVTHTWLSTTAAPQQETHHMYSHNGASWIGSFGNDFYNTAGYNGVTPSQYPQQLINIEQWYAQHVASLAYTLSQITSGSGHLLDQTVMCWGSELDQGNIHNHDDTPFVLIGGGAGKLKTGGQVVQFPMSVLGNSAQNNMIGTRFQNDLLVTLAEKVMGVDIGGTFGNPNYCTGPITEILA